MEIESKPHTRQKMKLKTQKKLRCAECSKLMNKRHVLLCFHAYCPACYSKLQQALCRNERGVVCSICKTFDPYNQKEERDGLPPLPCKLHPGKRYILYCITCNTRLCYSCKMGKHHNHESELLQDTLDRAAPLIQEEALKDKREMEEKVLQNEKEIEATQLKAEHLERYLKQQHRQLEQSLKQHYQKVRSMVDLQVNRRKKVLEAQTQLIKYFQNVKIPHHTKDKCTQQGAIQLQWGKKFEEDCRIGTCNRTLNYSMEEIFKIKSAKTDVADEVPSNQEKSLTEDADNVVNAKAEVNSDFSVENDKSHTASTNTTEISDSKNEEKSNKKPVINGADVKTIDKCADSAKEPATDNLNCENTSSSVDPSNSTNAKFSATVKGIESKPGNLGDLMKSIVKKEKSRAVATLCQCCAAKHGTAEDGVNYSEVYSALSSPSVTDIGEIVTEKESVFVRYTPGNIDTSNLLDTVDFDNNGNLIEVKTGNIIGDNILGKVEIVCQPAKRDTSILNIIYEKLIQKAEQEHAKNEGKHTETCLCYRTVNCKPTGCSFRTPQHNLASLDATKLKFTGKLTYDNKSVCNHVAFIQKKLWLPNSTDKDDTIIILDITTGETVNTISFETLDDINGIQSVYSFNYHQVLVAANSGAFIIDNVPNIEGKLMKGSFSDICHQGPLIAMLESVQSHVKIIDVSTNPPTLCADFHVFTTDSPVQSIVLQGQCVFMATNDHKLKKYDFNGDLLWQWGGEGTGGPGELMFPLVSAVDNSEALLVVDRDNKRLQVVDSHCQWQLLPLKEVVSPTDLLITDQGCLYVLSTDGRTIYCYSITD